VFAGTWGRFKSRWRNCSKPPSRTCRALSKAGERFHYISSDRCCSSSRIRMPEKGSTSPAGSLRDARWKPERSALRGGFGVGNSAGLPKEAYAMTRHSEFATATLMVAMMQRGLLLSYVQCGLTVNPEYEIEEANACRTTELRSIHWAR
jgi:hypothetical protein